MKFRSRSSRATAPKMRVPAGILVVVDDHRGVAVEADVAAVGRGASAACVRTITARTTAPFLTSLPAITLLTLQTMMSPMPANALARAAQHLEAHQFLGPGVVGHDEPGLHLNHDSRHVLLDGSARSAFRSALGRRPAWRPRRPSGPSPPPAPAAQPLRPRQRPRLDDLHHVAQRATRCSRRARSRSSCGGRTCRTSRMPHQPRNLHAAGLRHLVARDDPRFYSLGHGLVPASGSMVSVSAALSRRPLALRGACFAVLNRLDPRDQPPLLAQLAGASSRSVCA